ncbi:MAG: leucyl-tRNA synthetase [Bacteroidia bacterium]|jgi:leucyl-tRNA synthetase
MPGYAGSSWYFLRYMDPNNDQEFAGKESLAYWNQVDLYIGGTEHATGHLLYSRFWTKFLYDRGHIQFDEPFKKLVNQGMIQGESYQVWRLVVKSGNLMEYPDQGTEYYISNDLQGNDFLHHDRKKIIKLVISQFGQNEFDNSPFKKGLYAIGDTSNYVDIKYVNDGVLDFERLQREDPRFKNAKFLTNESNQFTCFHIPIEKMSKSKYNVVNPDDICAEYGADTLRLYEMFLGPLEDSKPWSTKGIDGTYRFLKKLWALFFDQDGNQLWTDSGASKDSMKTLHATIKKITEDIDSMSLNTSVAQFMICVNELGSQKCTSKSVLEQVLVLLNPFAPHITEELWNAIGNEGFIADAKWPTFDEKHLIESSKIYPISINGKTRTNLEFPLDMSKEEIEKNVLADEIVQKWLDGKPPKKVIVVPGRIVNVVM